LIEHSGHPFFDTSVSCANNPGLFTALNYSGSNIDLPDLTFQALSDHLPVRANLAKEFIAEMFDGATEGMHRTVEIEMDKPLTRSPFLKQEMEHGIRPPFLIKATARILVVGKPPGKIFSM
jgi:hypothetical protein